MFLIGWVQVYSFPVKIIMCCRVLRALLVRE